MKFTLKISLFLLLTSCLFAQQNFEKVSTQKSSVACMGKMNFLESNHPSLKIILWAAMNNLNDVNLYKECRTEIEPNVSGILLNDCLTNDSEMVAFAESLPNSIIPWVYWDKIKLKRVYSGEIITGNYWDNVETPKLLNRFKDTLLVDEADIDYLNTYLPYKCYVTFSNYRDYIKIFGWRIALCWTNQIWAWERLQKLYGNRFKDCWISLNLNKNDYPELISWCLKNNKQIMLFVDAGTSVEVFKERFSKFITEFNKQVIR